jgi:hypothetical protein
VGPLVRRTTWELFGQIGWSCPQHGVTEAIMMLADEMRPEATLLIGVI